VIDPKLHDGGMVCLSHNISSNKEYPDPPQMCSPGA